MSYLNLRKHNQSLRYMTIVEEVKRNYTYQLKNSLPGQSLLDKIIYIILCRSASIQNQQIISIQKKNHYLIKKINQKKMVGS
ncbi:hypothetical protein pb186bvf_001656 [Paramecium bursaria]